MDDEDWLAAEMVMNDACFAENGQGKRFARLADVEAEDHGARLEPVVQAEHAGRRTPSARKAAANHFILFGDAVGITRQRLEDQRIGMQAAPLVPIGEKKRIQLEPFAFERPGNGLQAGLLPATSGFAVLENLVAADDAGIVHVQLAPFAGGPEHEGRVAVASPGDGDGSGGRLIFDKAVLRENGGGVSFGDGSGHDADDAVRVVQKVGGRSGNKLRIVDRGVG
jgi:hypothetical protein